MNKTSEASFKNSRFLRIFKLEKVTIFVPKNCKTSHRSFLSKWDFVDPYFEDYLTRRNKENEVEDQLISYAIWNNLNFFWFDQILFYFITHFLNASHSLIITKKCHFYQSTKSGLQLIWLLCALSRISIESNRSKLWLKIRPFGKIQTFTQMLSCKACWPIHWELAWPLYTLYTFVVGLGFWSRSSLWCCWCMKTCRFPCCWRNRHFQLCRGFLWKPQIHYMQDFLGSQHLEWKHKFHLMPSI